MMLLIEPPEQECVSVEEAKAHLRVIHSSDDTLIGAQISAAREAVEQATGRALVAARYVFVQTGDVLDSNLLPLWPVQTIEAASYTDCTGVVTALDAADYTLLSMEGRLLVQSASGTGLTVDFRTSSVSVPAALKASILLLVADMYEQTSANVIGSTVSISPTVDRLLYPYRRNLGV